jgi:CubicO group peptidase (beta-lactamase class C family)
MTMLRPALPLVLSPFAVLLAAACCCAEAPAQIAAAVQKELEAKLFPGAVVLVGTPEKVLYHESFGLAQVTPAEAPMRKDSIFDVASVTKVVCTATAVGILKDRGLVDPDAPLTKYLPEHRGRGVERISLRRLASHTSGFAENPRVSRAGKLQGDAIFARMLEDEPAWPVNTHYQYACRNIIYLSTIVERAGGRPFGDFCQAEIFTPLEMADSAFNRVEPSPRVVATHHAVLGENHNPDGRDAGRAIGNAGLFTTAADLSHFCEMMLGGGVWRGRRILAAETIADFTKNNQRPEFPGRGFVWETDLKSNHRPQRMSDAAYGHSGYTGISLWIDPEKRVYTLVLTNRTHPKTVGKATPLGEDQYRARARIADAALTALGY